MKRRHNRSRGAFTIIEVIVIVVILGVIAAVVAPRLLSRVGQSKQSVAATNASSLATAMNLYILDCGMPADGAPLTILLERPADVDEAAWKGPYVQSADALRDPWGNQFILVMPGQINADFDILSYGSDGRPGGDGEAADVVNGKR